MGGFVLNAGAGLDDIVVLSAVRTPIGKFGGSLLPLSAADLGVTAALAAIARSGVAPEHFDETIFGHARQAGGGPNTARQISVRAGLPVTVPAYTVNKACASSLKAVVLAAQAIAMGDAGVVLAGGTESMSNTPYLLPRLRFGHKLGHMDVIDAMYHDGFMCPLCKELMGATAENLADEYGLSRREQDEYAVETQRRAAAAQQANRFHDEITAVAIPVKSGIIHFEVDEHPRADTSLEKLAALPTTFRNNGTVHAGNASGITDAAAALVIAHAKHPKIKHCKPLVKLRAYTATGVDPNIMGIGPVGAIKKLLEKTRLKLDAIGLIELNEAFAAQVLACQRELQLDMKIVNVNGGAIALGHPIGATGARICVTLIHEMKKRNVRFGIATLCVSGGMGMAVLFENIT